MEQTIRIISIHLMVMTSNKPGVSGAAAVTNGCSEVYSLSGWRSWGGDGVMYSNTESRGAFSLHSRSSFYFEVQLKQKDHQMV